jgi:hypothetical protein
VTEFSLIRVEDSRGMEEIVTEIRDLLMIGNRRLRQISVATFATV